MNDLTALALVFAPATILWATLAVVGSYQKFWWWDNLAHLSAGLSLGAAAGACAVYVNLPQTATTWAVIVAASASIVWESIEFTLGVWPWVRRTDLDRKWSDTLLDSYLVLTGAFLSGLTPVILG